jgi:hypothetical protein|nr:MAG TPA: hypothetical protein [Caudoviricetes sp.]
MGFSHYGTVAYIMYPIVNGEYVLNDLTQKSYEYVITISDGPEKDTKLIESIHSRKDANRYSNKYIRSRIVPAEKALIFNPEKWGHHDGAFKVSEYQGRTRPVRNKKCSRPLRKFIDRSYESLIAFLDNLHIKQILKLDVIQPGNLIKYSKYTLTNELLLETFRHDRDYSIKCVKFTVDTDKEEAIYKDRVYQNHVFLWVITETSYYMVIVTKDQWKKLFKLYNSRVITIQSAYKNETIVVSSSTTYKVIDTYLEKSGTGV